MGLMKKILYKIVGINGEMEELYRKKGLCNELVDVCIANFKNPKPYEKCLIADMLISVGRYAEAEDVLDNIKMPLIHDKDLKGESVFERINLYVQTRRYEQATEIFSQNQKFLDIYFNSHAHEKFSGDYFGAVARIFAANNNEQGASHYLSLEKSLSEKHETDFPISWKITNVAVLKLLGSDTAQAEYEKLKAEIESHDFPMVWQKEHNLKLLSQAVMDSSLT